MEVEAAARRMLLSDATTTGYVQDRVFKYRLEEKVDTTGRSAIVVARNNGWATPDPITTQEFPILTLKCYADPSRTADGEIKKLDAEDRAWALYRVTNRLIHGQRDVWWGGVGDSPGMRVVAGRRWAEPMIVTEKDRHGQSAGDPLGDSVYVFAQYALEVVHGPAGPRPDNPGGGSSTEWVTIQQLQEHINAAQPHPAYDVDMPSMTLIFENHLL